MYLLSTFLAFISIFICGEFLSRKLHLDLDVTRKITHVASGLLVFYSPYFLSKEQIIFLGLAFSVILIFTKIFGLLPSIHSVERRTFGEVFFPLGIVVSASLFLSSDVVAFQFGILILTISDTLAAALGILFGKHSVRILGQKKSLEGSLAFFLSAFFLAFIYIGKLGSSIFILGVFLTAAEFLFVFGIDNLILPALSSYLFIILR